MVDAVFLAMNGVVQSIEAALDLPPTRRLALVVITGRLLGNRGVWDWRDREWKRPPS